MPHANPTPPAPIPDHHPRTLHAIQVELICDDYQCEVIVWPADGDQPHHCSKLVDSKMTWLTAHAGNAVALRRNRDKPNEWTTMRISSIRLYRVYPVSQNGRMVSTAQAWLGGE